MVYLCTMLHTYIHEAYLYTYRTAKYFTSVTIQTGWYYRKKPHPSTNFPKCFWDWVTNIPFRKRVFVLIRLYHARRKDTIQLGRLAAKDIAFINPIKSRLIQAVAFTAVISCSLTVPNTPPEFLPGRNLPFPHDGSFSGITDKVFFDHVTQLSLSQMPKAS